MSKVKTEFDYNSKVAQLIEASKHPRKLNENEFFKEFGDVQLKADWMGKMKKGGRGIVLERSGTKHLMVEFPSVLEWDIIPASYLKLQAPK
jgi:hypothetical protein